jgi:hypothetical protein
MSAVKMYTHSMNTRDSVIRNPGVRQPALKAFFCDGLYMHIFVYINMYESQPKLDIKSGGRGLGRGVSLNSLESSIGITRTHWKSRELIWTQQKYNYKSRDNFRNT